MRTVAQLGAYLASESDDGLVIHQYADSTIRRGERGVVVETAYPWDGHIAVTIDATGGEKWTLRLRVPAWCKDASLIDPDGHRTPVQPGYISLTRDWKRGDQVSLELAMPVRLTRAHDRVDAVRGCRAIERGPLVYAVEQVDLPAGIAVDDLHLASANPHALTTEGRPGLLGGCVVVTGPAITPDGAAGPFTAVPYCLWANRGVGPMRIWIPLLEAAESAGTL